MSTTTSRPGYFGPYGGRFVAETLMPALEELSQAYAAIQQDPTFQAELNELLEHYVGRETPLYRARRLSAEVGLDVWLKREDLCHTGAHKVNNTLGQVLLAKRMGKTRIIAETGAASTAWPPPPRARSWGCPAWCSWAPRTCGVRPPT